MKIKNIFFVIVLIALSALYSIGKTLNVGVGKPYSNPAQAALDALPGDTILIHPGNYTGAYYISNLNGNANAWIVIMGTDNKTVVMAAGSEGFHFSDVNYIKIQNITFTGQTSNGMNMDDAGTFESPSRHIIVHNCDFQFMGAQGNNDFLKLSGIDSFEISYCKFQKGATGGSGIDMVGCHYGRVHHCSFDSMGSNSVQMKGGTQFIKIENNVFRNGGQRSLNLGGSTGYAFFRPQNAKFEAADITVYANVFVKGPAPIAYVGCERVDVANNTIYLPEKWVIRILQETVDTPRFVPCRNNMFRNNIIYFSSVVTTHVNVGSNTSPATFLFSHNLWYNTSNPSASTPTLPTTEVSGIKGQDPLFTSSENFILLQNSPAIHNGTQITGLPEDMQGFKFKDPPSRGAYEYGSGVSIKEKKEIVRRLMFPNPATSHLFIEQTNEILSVRISDLTGQALIEKVNDDFDNGISLKDILPGIYIVTITESNGNISSQKLMKF